MSFRATVALVGAGAMVLAFATGNTVMATVVLVAYCLWMVIRDWLNRRDKYASWTGRGDR